jgi:hypothetical protein
MRKRGCSGRNKIMKPELRGLRLSGRRDLLLSMNERKESSRLKLKKRSELKKRKGYDRR